MSTAESLRAIIAEVNGLARAFYAIQGYRVEDGYRFDRARHPQERQCWAMAVYAWETLSTSGTELQAVLEELEELEEEERPRRKR